MATQEGATRAGEPDVVDMQSRDVGKLQSLLGGGEAFLLDSPKDLAPALIIVEDVIHHVAAPVAVLGHDSIERVIPQLIIGLSVYFPLTGIPVGEVDVVGPHSHAT